MSAGVEVVRFGVAGLVADLEVLGYAAEIVEVGNHSRSPLAFANTAINIPKPQYPGAAKVLHATGPVSIKVVVSPDGSVFAAEPISGHPLLRGAAAAAACKATFRPSQLGGKSVMVSGVLTYNFAP